MLIFPPRPEDFKFSEAKSPRLRIVSYSDAARTIVVRGVTKTGLIHDSYTSTADRLIQTRNIPLTEIPLSVLVQTTTTGVQRGRLYVEVFLEFAAVPGVLLSADYVTTAQPITWPGGQIRSATEGRGYLFAYTQADPAAGNELVFNIPTNTIWRVSATSYQLNTSIDVATRTSRLLILNELGHTIFAVNPNSTQTAGLIKTYVYAPFLSVPAAFDPYIFGQLTEFILPASANLQTLTENIQPADQYSLTDAQVEQWLNP